MHLVINNLLKFSAGYKMIRLVIGLLFKFLFRSELKEINNKMERLLRLEEDLEIKMQKLEALHLEINASVDVHQYKASKSWAVISLQGRKADFVKFIDLGDSEIYAISKFLRQYERGLITIDAAPSVSHFLRFQLNKG